MKNLILNPIAIGFTYALGIILISMDFLVFDKLAYWIYLFRGDPVEYKNILDEIVWSIIVGFTLASAVGIYFAVESSGDRSMNGIWAVMAVITLAFGAYSIYSVDHDRLIYEIEQGYSEHQEYMGEQEGRGTHRYSY